MMVKRELHGAVGESSADQEIRKSNTIVYNLWKIWRPGPSGTGPHSRQAGKQAGNWADEIWVRYGILKACYRSKYSIFIFLTKVLHCLNIFDAFLANFSGKYYYKVVL